MTSWAPDGANKINLLRCTHSLIECSRAEKSSLFHLKSNNGNCDNVMRWVNPLLFCSLPSASDRRQNWFLQAARGAGGVDLSSTSTFSVFFCLPPMCLNPVLCFCYLWWCLQLNSECLVLKLARHFNSLVSCDEKISVELRRKHFVQWTSILCIPKNILVCWFYVDIMANQLKQRDLLFNIFMENFMVI